MKQSRLVFLFALAAILPQSFRVSARPPMGTAQERPVVLTSLGGNNCNRPKAPSRQHITCSYAYGYLVLDFAFSEGMCTGYVTDLQSQHTSQYTFDSSDLTVELQTEKLSHYYIEISTEHGNTYVGNSFTDEL